MFFIPGVTPNCPIEEVIDSAIYMSNTYAYFVVIEHLTTGE